MIKKIELLTEQGGPNVQQGLPDVYDLVNSNSNLSKPSPDTNAATPKRPGEVPEPVDQTQEIAPDTGIEDEDAQYLGAIQNFRTEFDARLRSLILRLGDGNGFHNSLDVSNKMMDQIMPIIKKLSKKFE